MAHAGRVFNHAGDGFMAEFASPSGAVAFVDEIFANARVPLRAGAHVGEVWPASNGDILGHGVNVAARLLGIASTGELIASADFRRSLDVETGARFKPRGVVKLDKMHSRVEIAALVSPWRSSPVAWLRDRVRLVVARTPLRDLQISPLAARVGLAGGALIAAAAVLLIWRGAQPTEYQINRVDLVAHSASPEVYPSLSPDGRFVVYAATFPPQQTADLYLQNTQGGDPILLTNTPDEDEFASTWSPSGDRIAFVCSDPTSLPDDRRRPCRIFVRFVPEGDERQVGQCQGSLYTGRLSWSSRDKLLLSDLPRRAPNGGHIRELDLSTGAATDAVPAQDGALDYGASYSPDGNKILFVRYPSAFASQIIIFDRQTRSGHIILGDRTAQAFVAWAPDGRSVLAASDRNGSIDLWQVRADGRGAPRRLGVPGVLRLDQANGLLAFEVGASHVNMVRLSSGGETPITTGDEYDVDPDFSPAGDLAFTTTHGESWIYVQRIGATLQRLATLDMNVPRSLRWSPDGRRFALVGDVDGHAHLFVGDAQTGRFRQISTADVQPSFGLGWSGDSASLLFSAQDDHGARLWRVPVDGGRPDPASDYGWSHLFQSADGLFAVVAEDAPVSRPRGIYRLDGAADPVRLTPEVNSSRSLLAFTVARGRLFYLYASDPEHVRLFSRPANGGPATRIADVAPGVGTLVSGVLGGLALDPRSGDFVYSRTTFQDRDIGVARLLTQ